MPPSLAMIEEFLACHRIAMVGISRGPGSFSAKLFDDLCLRRYDMVPVNPHVPSLQGRHCFARVQDIRPPVDAALLMTSPEVTEQVVRDCAAAGIARVWMHRAGGDGAVSARAVEFCHDHGIQVIEGECPYMFLPRTGAVHRIHAFLRRLTGRYPRQAHRA